MVNWKDREVEKTLSSLDIHQQWENSYRTEKNEQFSDLVIGAITKLLQAPEGSKLLDAGCGIGANSIRFAVSGFNVTGVDFSEKILAEAKKNIIKAGIGNTVKLQKENILSLSFEDNYFNYAVGWGVLMHIPDVSRAISELGRVLKRNGILVLSEINMWALHAIIVRIRKFTKREPNLSIIKSDAGIDYWLKTPSGKLLIRHTNIRWLMRELKMNGFIIKRRMTGQFSELYTKLPGWILKDIAYCINELWFKYIRIPQPALANIIVAKKCR